MLYEVITPWSASLVRRGSIFLRRGGPGSSPGEAAEPSSASGVSMRSMSCQTGAQPVHREQVDGVGNERPQAEQRRGTQVRHAAFGADDGVGA